MTTRRLAPLLVLLPIALAAACSDDTDSKPAADAGGTGGGGGGSGGGSGIDPTLPVWSNVFSRVIVQNACTQPQCHGAGNGGGLRLDGKTPAYQALVGVVAAGPCIADAGEPDGAAGANVNICGCGPSGLTRVVPGDPDASLLIAKLETTQSCGERMPPTGEPIP
ncbi:MAG: hypothetical protein FJ104_05020, partial [Deltaproteobacteria bacterium]|nr:hypothetical protein [Deltaproteobacteria bacterium]